MRASEGSMGLGPEKNPAGYDDGHRSRAACCLLFVAACSCHMSASISSAAWPPIMYEAALVPGPEMMDGMTEASATRSPWTRSLLSTPNDVRFAPNARVGQKA